LCNRAHAHTGYTNKKRIFKIIDRLNHMVKIEKNAVPAPAYI
jgi:hypothetical protein